MSKFPWLSNWVLFIKLLITHPLHLPEINDFIVLTSVNLFWNFIEILDQIIKIWDLIHFNNWNSILIHFTKEFWLRWQEESYYVIRHINLKYILIWLISVFDGVGRDTCIRVMFMWHPQTTHKLHCPVNVDCRVLFFVH